MSARDVLFMTACFHYLSSRSLGSEPEGRHQKQMRLMTMGFARGQVLQCHIEHHLDEGTRFFAPCMSFFPSAADPVAAICGRRGMPQSHKIRAAKSRAARRSGERCAVTRHVLGTVRQSSCLGVRLSC